MVVPALLVAGAVAVSASLPATSIAPVAASVAPRSATPAPGAHASASATRRPAHTPAATPAATPITVPEVTAAAAAAAPVPAIPAVSSPLPGCPPPPSPGGGGGGQPWHPDVLVPDSALPAPAPATGPDSPLTAITGKGVWIWQYSHTENGDMNAAVSRAVAAGLQQVWVRVADSQNGFYAADQLAQLVPVAHAHGLDVIAWGFPYFYDPVGDAQWSVQVLNWRAPDGEQVDGFSPDIEMASEGVMLSAQRVAVYLGIVRQARGNRPLVATVYPPTNARLADYPFSAMAPYVDAYAPMVYWECRDPASAASEAVTRLASMKPVHVIGQAFSFGDVGGRVDQPGTAEMQRFMGTSRQDGAIGASFWVWQDMNGEEWNALSAYPWQPSVIPPPVIPLLPSVH